LKKCVFLFCILLIGISLFLSACGQQASVSDNQAKKEIVVKNVEPAKEVRTNQLPVTILVGNYQQYDVGNGWKIGVAQLYFLNMSDIPVKPGVFKVKNIFVQTKENQPYPADLQIETGRNPLLGLGGNNYRTIIAGGKYDWTKPREIMIGHINQRGGTNLPIPSKVPFANSIRGEYWVGFRYAQAATPSKIHIEMLDYGTVVVDITDAEKQIIDPIPNEVGARSQKDLASRMSFSNDQYDVIFSGDCVYRVENVVRNKLVYLPFRVVNRNAFKEQKIVMKYRYAIYRPGGLLRYTDWDQNRTVGPGQTVDDLFLIELLMTENDPLPVYLIYYPEAGGNTIHNLKCRPYIK